MFDTERLPRIKGPDRLSDPVRQKRRQRDWGIVEVDGITVDWEFRAGPPSPWRCCALGVCAVERILA